mmetsp:Transcript_6908/g.16885  ORF Transcript_6908/g.16885 Transcript_6908/m.16885 type:complete len:342 (-) Transcript_6908:60-1085(-)
MLSHLLLVFFSALSADSQTVNLADLSSTYQTRGDHDRFTTWNLTFLNDSPSLVPTGGPPDLHVAHCMAGELRSLYFRSVYKSYKKAVINSLDAPSKLFIITNAEESTERYKPAFDYLQPDVLLHISHDELQKSNLHFEGSPERCTFQYSKYAICYEIVRRHERHQRSLFSHIIITRPDVLMRPVGPAASWRRDFFMAPPTMYTLGQRPWPPVSKVLARSLGSTGFPRPWRYRRRVTEIFNIVPRGVAHGLFAFLTRPVLPGLPTGPDADRTGDRIWFEILKVCNITISWHPLEYHIVRDANDPIILRNMEWIRENYPFLRDQTIITFPSVIPGWMILYRTA